MANETQTQPHDHYPTCRYCGKQTLPTAPYPTIEAADEAATITCDCYEAKKYQDELRRKEERDKNIVRLTQRLDDFSNYCGTRGAELQGDLYNILLNTGICVLDGVIASANIKFARLKVNINQNNKGNIVIGFTYSDGAKVEV